MSDINVTVQDEIVNIDVLDTPVIVEVTNSPGPAGAGVAAGGTTGQVLAKASNTNYDTVWVNPSTGGVPYSGATGNVDLGEYELKAGQIEFDQTPTGTAGVGVMRWNDADGTLDLGLKGGNVTLQVGQEQVARVVNKTGSNLLESEYKAVRISGAQGQRLGVQLAQANNDANSADTIGIVTENINNNQEGFITTMGTVREINTTGSLQGETWADGDVLYLSTSTAGLITNVKPDATQGHIVVIGYVEYAHAQHGKIYVKVMNGWELGELHDVYVPTPSNNDALIFETSSGLWKNKSITTALGYTPVPTTRNITINGVTYDLSADRTWTIAAGISGSGASGQVTYWTGTSAVSGSNNLFWDNANGRLGIGTNAPARTLSINGSIGIGTNSLIQESGALNLVINQTAFYNLELRTNNATRLTVFASGNIGINTSDLGVRLGVVGDTLLRGSGNTSATTALTVQNSSSTNLFTVLNDGKVGIGTNAPSSLVHAFASSGAATSGFMAQNNGTAAGDLAAYSLQNQTQLSRIFLTTAAYTNVPMIGANGLAIYANGGSGITFWNDNASGSIKFGVGSATAAGSQRMTVFSNGNVGIGSGNTDLGTRLGVVGDTILRGSGATSATTALTVQNSSSVNLLSIKNDGDIVLGIRTGGIRPSLTIGPSFQGSLNFTTVVFANWNTTAYAVFTGIDPASSTFIFGGTTINASAKLQIDSTTSGFLPPRMTTTQKNAISSPAAGLVVYDTTLNKLCVYTTAWETITSI